MKSVDYKDSIWGLLRNAPPRIASQRRRSWTYPLANFPEEDLLAAVHLTAWATQ